ncbi:MAG: hypothetical protein A2W19_03630 [Spirochaetes bacterium RBG_16_49_21]|nr:MAG: hypothetical protein A2W19_03630 [Spirochaetes bacterium RBG_16_49_21]
MSFLYSMAFLASLRACFPGDMAIYAKAMHPRISIFPIMAFGANLYPFRIVVLMVAVKTFQTLFLMSFMGHLNRADLAFISRADLFL